LIKGSNVIGLDHLLDVTSDGANHANIGFFEQVEKSVAQGATDDDADSVLLKFPATFKNGVSTRSVVRPLSVRSCESTNNIWLQVSSTGEILPLNTGNAVRWICESGSRRR